MTTRTTNALRRLFTPRFSRGTKTTKHDYRTRLRIDSLEDRAVPATFTVNTLADSGGGSLREAINSANTATTADTIDFTVTGTITLATALPQISTAGGDLTITGPGAASLTVNANGVSRVLDSVAPNLTISGLTLTGGLAAASNGGGIRSSGTLRLDGMNITGNSVTGTGFNAGSGGGIGINGGGFVMVQNSTISGNQATQNGGGIYLFNNGSAFVENSTIDGNSTTVDTAAGYGGGAFYMFGTASAAPPTGFVISSVVFRNSTIANNSSVGSGGGINLRSFGGTLLVQGSTITGNTAANVAAGQGGGGILAASGTITVTNSVVAGNSNPGGTAANIRSAGTVNFNFSAVDDAVGFTPTGTNNVTGTFASMNLGALTNNGGPTRTIAPVAPSTLIDAGSAGLIPVGVTTDQRGFGYSRSFGIVDIGAVEVQPFGIPAASVNAANVFDADLGETAYTFSVTYFDALGTNRGIVTSSVGQPAEVRVTGPGGFSQLATFDGVTGTVNGEPQIATYTIAVPFGWTLAHNGTYTVNLDGVVEDNDLNDVPTGAIGTFQVLISETFVVTTAVESGTGSLRDAITLANLSPASDFIVFDPGVFNTQQTILLTSALPQFSVGGGGLTITGPGSDLVTLQRNAGSPAFRVLDSNTPSLSLSGLTVSGGAGVAAGVAAFAGGSLVDMVFTGNAGTDFGTLYVQAGTTVSLVDSTISNNTSARGAGVFVATGGTLNVINSTISGNTATTNGGGIHFSNGGNLTVVNSTISGNTASGTTGYMGGGGIGTFGSVNVLIQNSTIANNNTTGSGGGIFIGGNGTTLTAGNSYVVIQQSTISGNSAAATGLGTGTFTYAFGGGGIAMVASYYAYLNVVNSIVSGNTNGFAADINSEYGTFAAGSAIGTTAGIPALNNYGDNQLDATFVLGALADNGGPTKTMALPAGSPLIDAGNDNFVFGLTEDQIGGTHERIFGADVDIGAVEVQPPEVTIEQAVGQADPTNATTITFDIVFDAAVEVATFTVADDIDLDPLNVFGGALAGNLIPASANPFETHFTLEVTGMVGEGVVQPVVLQGVVLTPVGAIDASGEVNDASTSIDNEVTFDTVKPTAKITQTTIPVAQPDPTNSTVISFNVHFSEDVTDFDDLADVLTTGSTPGLVSSVSIVPNSADDYTVLVTLTGVPTEGDVVINVPANAAVDGIGNLSEAATIPTIGDNSVHYDAVAPTATVTRIGAATAFGSQVQFDVVFTEAVTGFTASPAQMGFTGSATGLFTTSVTGSGSAYVVTVSGFTAGGTVTASILPSGAPDPLDVKDLAGNVTTGSTPNANDTVTYVNSGTVQFTSSTYTVDEFAGTTALLIEVTRTGGTEGDLTVDYAVSGGTASGIDDFDGATATGALTFPAGSSASQFITITILDDTIFEPSNETVVLQLSNVEVDIGGGPLAAASALGTQSSTTLTIDDFEAGKLTFSLSAYSAAEGGTAVITVNRIEGFDGDVSIPYTMTLGTTLGSASLNDIDGTNGGVPTTNPVMPVPNVLSWDNGISTPILINLPIDTDTLSEGRETINFGLTSASVTGNALLGITSATLTIAPSNPITLDPAIKLVKTTVTETDGDIATVAFGGKAGKVNVYKTNNAGPISIIELVGTDAKSTVTVTVKKATGGNGKVDIGEVTGTGLKSFKATASDLIGLGVNLTGYLGSLTIADVKNEADIIFAAGTDQKLKTNITAGVVGNGSDITATGAGLGGIKGVTVTSFGDGTITAKSADSITTKVRKEKKDKDGNVIVTADPGDFGADVTLTGASPMLPSNKIPATLGKLTVAGSIKATSDINVDGFGTTYKVGGSVENGAVIDVLGTLKTLTVGTAPKVAGDLDVLDGTFSAASISGITVNGNLLGDITISGAGVAAGKATLGTLKVNGKKVPTGFVGGEVVGSTITVGSNTNVGNITSVTAVKFVDSFLYAGYNVGTGAFNPVLDPKKPVGTVGTFTVSGATDAFANSDLFASTFKTVKLGSVKTDNGIPGPPADPFGFNADKAITKLSIGKTVFFTSPADDALGKSDGDFTVKIV